MVNPLPAAIAKAKGWARLDTAVLSTSLARTGLVAQSPGKSMAR